METESSPCQLTSCRADQLRLADEIQRCYNAKDDIQHFFDVTLHLHEQAVTEITGIENQTLVRYLSTSAKLKR